MLSPYAATFVIIRFDKNIVIRKRNKKYVVLYVKKKDIYLDSIHRPT
jgi:hypothetical protein